MKTGPRAWPFPETILKNPYFCIFLQETGNTCPKKRPFWPSIASKSLNPNILTIAEIS
jgi:hypothetical protein